MRDRFFVLASHNCYGFPLVEEGFLNLLFMIFLPVCGPRTSTDPPLKKTGDGLCPLFARFGFKVLFSPWLALFPFFYIKSAVIFSS